MGRDVHLDVETRSDIDLKKAGVYRYVQSPNTDVWMVRYAFDSSDEILEWRPGDPAPDIREDDTVFAWNAQFERIIWRDILTPRYGWPVRKNHGYADVMVWALAMALPPSLDMCARALGLNVAKDLEGYRLMMRMAKPRKARKDEDPDALLWWDDEERIERLSQYCRMDVIVEREIAHRLVRPSRAQHRDWLLDQHINDVGVRIDLPLVKAAKGVALDTQELLNDAIYEASDGAVTKTTQVQRIKDYLLDEHGLVVESMDKDHAPLLLAQDLPDAARRVIELRVEGSKTSVKKLDAMLEAEWGERIRGLFRFSYATTGRWSSSIVQLHNQPQGAGKLTDALCALLLDADVESIHMIYGPALTAISDAIRGCLIPTEGYSFSVADLAQIEARITAFLAGQLDLIQIFRDYDAGTGRDVYVYQADKVGSSNRQLGKVMVLALGFGMGADRFRETALTYGIELKYEYVDRIDEKTGEVVRDVIVDEAEELKTAWRQSNQKIQQFWWDLEEAAVNAVMYPGRTFHVGDHIQYRTRGDHLWCRLPSGRTLCYPFPKLKETETPWGTVKLQLTYMTMFNGHWVRQSTYGGHLAENVAQATANDVLRTFMMRAHKRLKTGRVVAHVHDEAIAEGPIEHEEQRLADMVAIMSEPVDFLPGCPLAADGFNCMRYRKG